MSSSAQLRRLFRANTNMALLGGNTTVNHLSSRVPKDYESSRISDASRFEDEPPPTEDDMISKVLII